MLDPHFDVIVVEDDGFSPGVAERINKRVIDERSCEIAGFVDLLGAVCARAPGFVGGAGLSLEHRPAARAPDQTEAVTLLRRDLLAGVEDGVVARAAGGWEGGVFAR